MTELHATVFVVEPWINMAVRSLGDIAATLGLGECHQLTRPLADIDGCRGAAISLHGEGLEVGMVLWGSFDHLTTLAARFLKLAPGVTPSEDDVRDAICELSNMLAGGVKAGMRRQVRGLRITLPTFGAIPPVYATANGVVLGVGGCELHVRLSPLRL